MSDIAHGRLWHARWTWTNIGQMGEFITITIPTWLMNSCYASLAETWLTVAIACSTPDLLNNKFWILSNMKSPLLSSPDVVWRLLCNCVARDAPDNVCADLCNNNCAKVYHNSHNWRKHFTRIFFKSIYSSSVSCISNLGSDRKSLCRTLQNFAKCLQILSNVHSSRNTSVINLSPRMCNSMIMFLALATHDCQKDQMIFGDLDSHLMKR